MAGGGRRLGKRASYPSEAMTNPLRSRLLPPALVVAVAAAVGLTVGRLLQRPPPPEESAYRPVRHLPPQEPVSSFPVKRVAEVRDGLNPEERVLGVTVGDEARAYPLCMLAAEPRYKVLNDTLGGEPVAATWCDACHSAVAYSRAVDGRVLTFAVTGQLWNDSMVLYDVETQSRWSQLLGRSMTGVFKDRELRPVPSVVTDWQTWCRLHPDGTVVWLPFTSQEYRRELEKAPGQFVLGVAAAGSARDWGLDRLLKAGAVNDEWNGRPVLAALDRPSLTARLYDRTQGQRVLTFRVDGDRLVDAETGSAWEPLTGRAVAGPLAGQHLVPLPATLASRDAWGKLHPRSP
jgi:hypothetical protein